MDRKLNSDEQWYISPLLDLHKVRNDLLECRDSAEDTIDREIQDRDRKTEAEQELEMWMQSLETTPGILEEEAALAIEEVGNIDIFLEGPSETHIQTLEEMKGDRKFLEKSVLHTHKHLLKREEQMKSSRQRKSAYVTSLKYDKYLLNGGMNTKCFRPQCSLTSKCDDDIVIVVDVMIPYNRQLQSNELRTSRLLKPQSKFMLRGDTLLSDLRRKLHCISDTIFPLENGLELEPVDVDETTASKYPSAFIFINRTFYVDSSHPNACDISFPIRKFMEQKEIFEETDAQVMEGVKIIDLQLRLGQPYVFQHSGNCEHLLIFHDLRLLHETDPRGIDNYPFVLFQKGNEKKCDFCKKSHVEFVVERHELLPNTYTYFCRSCFQEYNFVHGVKTHSFYAWPYTETQAVSTWQMDDMD
uniref:snRNA-activating protein complex subunit 3 n=1 Tax=Caenorhabditis tropicalis TaxID=1561998 RepID=A0A1I7UMN3_9PELO